MDSEHKSLLEKNNEHSWIPYAKYILFTNCGMSCTFYGLNSIFAVYLNQSLGFSTQVAGLLTNLSFFLNYGLAVLGGILADSKFGQFRMVVLGVSTTAVSMSVFLASQLALSHSEDVLKVFALTAMLFFVIGSGIMKPSVTALLGDQFKPEEDKARSAYFSWFYLAVQTGSIGASIGIPLVYQYLPTWVPILILTITIFLTLPTFLIPSRNYRKVDPQGNAFALSVKVVLEGIRGTRSVSDRHWLDKAKKTYGDQTVEDVKTSLRVLKIFALLPFFWGIFFQMYSLWVFEAEAMNRVFSVKGKSFTIPASETLSLNPMLDVILIPLFAKVIYPVCAKIGVPLTPLRRIGVGIVFTIGSLIVAGFVQLSVDHSPAHSVHVAWIIPQFFLVSCGEVLLSVTAYEFAYTEAPRNMKGLLTALWLLTIALGNIIVIVIQLVSFSRAIQYFFLAGLMGVVLIVFLPIARGYQYKEPTPVIKAAINDDE